MLRLFILAQLFLLSLYACDGTFSSCIHKIKDSQSIYKNRPAVVVKNHQRIVYSRQIPNAAIVKYDPFLSLYLIEDRTNFRYPFTFDNKLQLHTAIVNAHEAKAGKFIKKQIGLDSFGKYSASLSKAALILNSCCSLEGIVTSNGIIKKAYLKHFLNAKKVVYGDIGIRVKENKNGSVLVTASDPFIKNNPFKKGDYIILYDGKKIGNAAELMRKILFSDIGSKHSVTIKRDTKFITFKVKIHKRYGGGYLSDTFLEQKGIYFDKALHITRLYGSFKNYGLKVGDKLIKVNAVAVNNQEQLRLYIEKYKDYSSLLFERNKFQFFVNIK
ncbi:PDZ domain-containing protein [Sulfurimonas sp.]|uniref:DUF7488 domain-containing protein n=1 Tax=Sulfurimonas sp. TaxID=2022749 RepID=UPI002638C245|nr:PDZ domain-containing protein [Sulfurimonas sp.]